MAPHIQPMATTASKEILEREHSTHPEHTSPNPRHTRRDSFQTEPLCLSTSPLPRASARIGVVSADYSKTFIGEEIREQGGCSLLPKEKNRMPTLAVRTQPGDTRALPAAATTCSRRSTPRSSSRPADSMTAWLNADVQGWRRRRIFVPLPRGETAHRSRTGPAGTPALPSWPAGPAALTRAPPPGNATFSLQQSQTRHTGRWSRPLLYPRPGAVRTPAWCTPPILPEHTFAYNWTGESRPGGPSASIGPHPRSLG